MRSCTGLAEVDHFMAHRVSRLQKREDKDIPTFDIPRAHPDFFVLPRPLWSRGGPAAQQTLRGTSHCTLPTRCHHQLPKRPPPPYAPAAAGAGLRPFIEENKVRDTSSARYLTAAHSFDRRTKHLSGQAIVYLSRLKRIYRN